MPPSEIFNISHIPVYFFFFFFWHKFIQVIYTLQPPSQHPITWPQVGRSPNCNSKPLRQQHGRGLCTFFVFLVLPLLGFLAQGPFFFFLRHFNGVFSSRVHASYGGPADSICTMHICARAPKKRKKKIILKKLMTLAGVYTLLRSNKGVMNHMPNEFIV